MESFKQMKTKIGLICPVAIVAALVVTPVTSLASCFLPASDANLAADAPVSESWQMTFNTATLPSYRDPELSITPVIDSKILFSKKHDSQILAYEDLWYASREQGACLGAKRHMTLGIPARDYVTIACTDDTESPEQLNAATDTIARLLLDVQLNDDWIESVVVPDQAFDEFTKRLGFYHISKIDPETPEDYGSAFTFTIKSHSGCQTAVMQYCQ
ncbi:MAG TPA: hypothetical protein V6C97_29560 [Oculatellaceae cyanobacterium]